MPDTEARVQYALGLRLPVRFEYGHNGHAVETLAHGASLFGQFLGTDRVDGERVHRIWVNPYLTAEIASRAAWHEAVHAKQSEQFNSFETFVSSYAISDELRGYAKNGYEQEARAKAPYLMQAYGRLFEAAEPRELPAYQEGILRVNLAAHRDGIPGVPGWR